MNFLIVYESVYGNMAQVAAAIDTAFQECFPVDIKAIGEIEQFLRS
jgi:hypothetical protein